MQCNITFDLDSPEDAAAHLRCTKSNDLVLCLAEFNIQLFSIIKYNELTEEQAKIYSEINTLFQDTLEEYGIRLDELNI